MKKDTDTEITISELQEYKKILAEIKSTTIYPHLKFIYKDHCEMITTLQKMLDDIKDCCHYKRNKNDLSELRKNVIKLSAVAIRFAVHYRR